MKLRDRTLKIVLVLSLGLNLLIIGSMAGFVFNGRHKDPRVGEETAGIGQNRRQAPVSMVGPVLRSLEREDRRALGRMIQESSGDQTLTRAKRDAMVASLADALRADPFDAAVVERLFDQAGVVVNQQIARTQQSLLQHISSMDRAKRAAIADRLERPRRR